ncbi:MAG: hypothetical protein CMJ50_05470 [Planctomycetaceae bacterium]|nr:hypothetical protein [Planctomycetaceae bacterium]
MMKANTAFRRLLARSDKSRTRKRRRRECGRHLWAEALEDRCLLTGILSVFPTSAAPGTTDLSVSFTLDSDAVPPPPPSQVAPTSAEVGTIQGSALTRSDMVVTASFDIPVDEPTGTKDLAVAFPTPNGTITMTLDDGFTVLASNLPVVSIMATDANAAESGLDTGTFAITRSGSTNGDLTVQFSLDGSATETDDFLALARMATIPDGLSSVNVTLMPVDDNVVESSETVTLSVEANTAYSVGTADTATVNISDNNAANLEGYTLLAPMTSTETYLIDNDGTPVHTWTSDYNPGLSTYLLEDGTLMRTASLREPSQSFTAGGASGRVEQWSWDGELLWEFEYSDSNHCLHHDIEVLPNGNVLMIAWEYISQTDAIAAGRDPSLLADGKLWPDHIIEVEPVGISGGNVIWEWHAWDHLVQDYDPTKANYGVVADHPELIDVNYASGQGRADWNHTNSIDYNADLDQILLSVRGFSEIWVIDHSTTTAEAASHTGGNSSLGGDILYRWGNAQTYDAGTAAEQQLFSQHDAEWIGEGLPGEDNILVFNNGTGRDYSTVEEIATPVEADGSYTLVAGQSYSPDDLAWSYTADPATSFYADHISGAQRLANGNTLITDGTGGILFEVTTSGDIVWQYDVGGQIFRADRYATAYSGFDGTDLDDNPGDDPVDLDLTYVIVDTGQIDSYDDVGNVIDPSPDQAFYGQDAQHNGNQSSYTTSVSGLTVDDNITGLTWTQSPDWDGDGDIDTNDKFSWEDAQSYVDTLNALSYDGYSDWSLPSIKELYSLIDFTGITGMTEASATPYIDTDYFAFDYGDESSGERIIDAQYWSSSEYVSTTMNGGHTVFGVNFADGRIKGYGTSNPSGAEMTQYVRYVRGDTDYGLNDFVDNGDSTVTDNATGLTWARDDSGIGRDWEDALAWVQEMNDTNYLGYSDWRLPNAKELQSIVDYSRSPDTTGSAAIDSVFNVSTIIDGGGDTDYPSFWSSTTHLDGPPEQLGNYAVYVAFGEAEGWMQFSPGGDYQLMDVHGAGAQRSDPKSGDPADYPYGHGPQGDVISIYNYVRLVRDADDGDDDPNERPTAEAGDAFTVEAGNTITLDGSASTDPDGTIVLYQWDLDSDGQYDDATGVTARFSAVAVGTYTVGLQVTDDDGAQDTDTTSITITAPPNAAPTAKAGGPYEGVVGNTITLDGSASTDTDGTIVLYQWDLDSDGQFDDATGVTANFSAVTVGTYTVGLQVTDDDGAQDTDTTSITITAPPNAAPTAKAGGPYEGVVGNTITLDGSASVDADGTVVLYQWDLDGDGQYDDANGVSAEFYAAEAGTFTVGLQVTDDDGAQNTDTAVLDITDVDEPNHAPRLAHPIQNQTAPANRRLRLQLRPDTFVDPNAGQSLSYAATQADGSPLPRWLRFNSQTMTFSGRPLVRDVGQYDVRVTATDSGSPALATSSEFTISVVGHPFRAQNADLPQDVDGNELVTPRDALILINWINANGPGPAPDSVPETVEGSLSFVDVNGDDAISPMDVLMVVNHLNHPSLTSVPLAEGEGTIATTSPRATPTLHAPITETPFTETPFTETPFTETLRRAATTVDLAFSQNAELSSPADLDELLGVLAHDTGRGETECDDLAMAEIV